MIKTNKLFMEQFERNVIEFGKTFHAKVAFINSRCKAQEIVQATHNILTIAKIEHIIEYQSFVDVNTWRARVIFNFMGLERNYVIFSNTNILQVLGDIMREVQQHENWWNAIMRSSI